MDRGNLGLQRSQVNGRFQSPAEASNHLEWRPQSPGPRFQGHGQRFQSPGRPRPQSPGPYGRRDNFPRPRTPPAGPTDFRLQGFQGRRFQSPGPSYERPPPPRDDRDVVPGQSYQPHDQPQRPATSPPPPRSPSVPRRNPGCYVCGSFGCHSDIHQDQRPPRPRYDSAPIPPPQSTNPFQDDV